MSLQVGNAVVPLKQKLMYAYGLHISYKTLENLQYIDNVMVHLDLYHTSNNYLDISLERLDNLNLDLPLSYAES